MTGAMNDDYRKIRPRDAERYCNLIRHDNRRLFKVFGMLWCWGCQTFSRGMPYRMCGRRTDCPLVVRRHLKEQRLKTSVMKVTKR